MDFAHLAQRMFNTPVAIHPRKAEIAIAALSDRLGITSMVRLGGHPVPSAFDQEDEEFSAPRRARQDDPGYDLLAGVAIVPVSGTLVQKRGTLRPYSGMTGYDGIRQAFLTSMADPAVRAVALDISSPGGEVAGCFDLVDTIYGCRGEKPIAAILTESAFSAAYAIASAVDPGRIFVPRTGGTGSIGVICMHVDLSEALTKAGVKVTFITSDGADRKTDGSPELPLSQDALAAIQGDIDTMGTLFHETVGRNRGIAASEVRGLKAGTFLGANGVTAGLADAVMAPDEAFASLLAAID